MPKRKICAVTGSRAEYGLLFSLLKDLQADSEIDFQLIITGTHLSSDFGSTYKLIEDDGFLINQKVDLGIDGDNASDIARSIGRGTIGFTEAFSQLQPDILLVLGVDSVPLGMKEIQKMVYYYLSHYLYIQLIYQNNI